MRLMISLEGCLWMPEFTSMTLILARAVGCQDTQSVMRTPPGAASHDTTLIIEVKEVLVGGFNPFEKC